MKLEKQELEIRQLFEKLRDSEHRLSPSFRETLEWKGERPSVFVAHYRLAGALALLMICVMLVAIHWWKSGETLVVKQVSVGIMEWEAPTDFLLDLGDDSLLTGVPVLGAEIPSWVEIGEPPSGGK